MKCLLIEFTLFSSLVSAFFFINLFEGWTEEEEDEGKRKSQKKISNQKPSVYLHHFIPPNSKECLIAFFNFHYTATCSTLNLVNLLNSNSEHKYWQKKKFSDNVQTRVTTFPISHRLFSRYENDERTRNIIMAFITEQRSSLSVRWCFLYSKS